MSNILIIKLGSLGDIVQIGGVLRDIRETHRNEKIFIPHNNSIYHKDDIVYFIGKTHKISNIQQIAGKPSIDIQNIMILGAGKIGRLLSKSLESEYRRKSKDRKKPCWKARIRVSFRCLRQADIKAKSEERFSHKKSPQGVAGRIFAMLSNIDIRMAPSIAIFANNKVKVRFISILHFERKMRLSFKSQLTYPRGQLCGLYAQPVPGLKVRLWRDHDCMVFVR